MNKFEILNKIGVIINELQDQYDYTDDNRDNIEDLELELFVANAHFLTDHIEILRKLNSQQAKLLREGRKPVLPEEKTVAEPPLAAPYFEPIAQSASLKTAEIPTTELTVVYEPLPSIEEFIEPEKVEELIPEPVITQELLLAEENPKSIAVPEPEPNPWVHQQPVAEIVETTTEPQPNPWAYQPPVAEVKESEAELELEPNPWPLKEPVIEQPVYEIPIFTPEIVKTPIFTHDVSEDYPKTINEMISAQKAPVGIAGDKTELPSIKDLKSAINLNDKLLYVRDLFNGYSMAYGEAIEILNRFNKFEEADQFLKANYYNKNQWEDKQTTTDKFYLLLQRRFPV